MGSGQLPGERSAPMSTTHVHDESEYLAKRTLKRGTAGWVLRLPVWASAM